MNSLVETSQMGNIVRDKDSRPEKMEKKSKKSKKHKTNDLLDVDDGNGNGNVEVDCGLQNEKEHKHKEKKRKSELNENEDEARHEKHKLEDGDFLKKRDKKKRKRDSSENNLPSTSTEKAQIAEKEQGPDDMPAVERDCNLKPRKEKKKKCKGQERKIENNSVLYSKTSDLLGVDGNDHVKVHGGLREEKGHKHRVKKRKSELNEDEAQPEKGTLEDDGDLRKDKKKTKRDSSENNRPSTSTEKPHIEDKEQDPNDGPAVNLKPRKEKKRKHKHEGHERKLETDSVFSSIGISESEKGIHDEDVDGDSRSANDITVMKNDVVGADKKNTQRGEKKNDSKAKKKISDGKGSEISREDCEGETEKFDKKKKKKKKKEKKDSQNSDAKMRGGVTDESGKKGFTSQDKGLVDGESNIKSILKARDGEDSERSKGKKKTTKSAENNSEKPKAKGKSKKVSFSGHVEVFPSSDAHPEKQKTTENGLVRGKRFTPEEDAIIKEAIMNYVQEHDLGEEGLKKVMNCSSHGMKNCWKEIGTCIPYRPYTAVYYRAHILFERAEKRSWTPEEIEFLKKFHEKHGNNWKMVAEELGKHRFHVKDTWRRIKLRNKKGGHWTQEEYQSLYDLVNLDLRMKVESQEKKSKYGMLRDNIPWGAISEKLSTRSDATCCMKWYNQLTSSLVAEKKWSDADDYRLIGALYDLDAACAEDVDWDNLLEHRPGDVCRKRWDQMVLHIGHHGSKPFAEQVETLAKRYCPDIAETREAWDNKPVVP